MPKIDYRRDPTSDPAHFGDANLAREVLSKLKRSRRAVAFRRKDSKEGQLSGFQVTVNSEN
jgi:hypothetical protein